MAIPTPVILDDPGIKISSDGLDTGLTELGCSGSHLEISPDVSVTTLDTFCGSIDLPGIVKWSLILTLYQSFDPAGPEEILSAAVALPTKRTLFEVTAYKSQPVSATNPMWTGEVIPQPYSPLNGDAGDASTIELEWSIVGEPTKLITPPAAAAAAAGEEEAEETEASETRQRQRRRA